MLAAEELQLSTEVPNTQIPLSISLKESYDCVGIKQLESTLRDCIADYRSQSTRSGYRTLSKEISHKVSAYLSEQGYSTEEIEQICKKRVPSSTYIASFSEGSNICINYMNTLAFFFNVSFMVNNFSLA